MIRCSTLRMCDGQSGLNSPLFLQRQTIINYIDETASLYPTAEQPIGPSNESRMNSGHTALARKKEQPCERASHERARRHELA